MPHQRKQFCKKVHFSNDSSDERITYLEDGFRKPKIEIEETVPYTELDLFKKMFDSDLSVPSTISCKSELIETTATTSIATTAAATTTTAFFNTPCLDLSPLSTANQPLPESPNIQLLVPFTSAIPVRVPSTISCKSVLIETTDTPIATTTTELFDASDLDFLASSIADEPVSDSPDLQLSAPFTSTTPVPVFLDSQSPASSTRSGRKYSASVSSLSSISTSTRKRTVTKRNSTAFKIARNSEEYSGPVEWITENFQPPVVNKFSSPSGIQCNVDVTSTPLDCFRHFVDDKIIKIIVQETNRYANNVITSTVLSHRSRMKQWKDTTPSEILEFLALIILMGMVKKPALSLYFSTDPIYSTPIFGAAMSKNRFLSILSNLCFSNSKKVTEGNRLQEIKSISDRLSLNFRKNYLPNEHVCIDESLMLWKGQLGCKKYTSTKRLKFGIKSYELCESRSGYVWNFLMYDESSMTFTDDRDSQGEEVVMTLMEPLLGKNYKVYVDRFFSSPSLAERLLEAQTYMCGTVMKNRTGMPKNFPSEQLNHGEIKTYQKNGISVFTWRDKKEVILISTMSDNTITETTMRDKKTNEFIRKPTCVVQYNKYMGGVSLCDSVIHAYPSMHKSTKWYKKVFFHMIDISLYNAWIIYKALGNNVPLLEFRHDVVQALLRKHHVPRMINRKRSGENPLRLTERHFPALNEKNEGKIVFRRCKLCFLKKKRKETKYVCPDCNIPLCTYPCFRDYHTKLNF